MRAQLLVVLTVATALLNLCNAWLAVTFLFVFSVFFRFHRYISQIQSRSNGSFSFLNVFNI